VPNYLNWKTAENNNRRFRVGVFGFFINEAMDLVKERGSRVYLLIDHYDSFVYNLKAYMEELNCPVQVMQSELATVDAIERIGNLEGIVFSPGPKRPEDCGRSAAILRAFGHRIPILGVCLGHQLIGHTFGAKVTKGLRPMHGKITRINHNNTGILQGLPLEFDVTRYHSLVVSEDSLPDCLRVDAKAEDGAVMAISHQMFPVFGVQFHPEAILSQHGYAVLNNFIEIAGRRGEQHG
jgi:anthranilate synthase/aminodeoxychorismate synthase-like glutamine amidotransferase